MEQRQRTTHRERRRRRRKSRRIDSCGWPWFIQTLFISRIRPGKDARFLGTFSRSPRGPRFRPRPVVADSRREKRTHQWAPFKLGSRSYLRVVFGPRTSILVPLIISKMEIIVVLAHGSVSRLFWVHEEREGEREREKDTERSVPAFFRALRILWRRTLGRLVTLAGPLRNDFARFSWTCLSMLLPTFVLETRERSPWIIASWHRSDDVVSI